MMKSRATTRGIYQRFVKRVLDILVGGLGLILISPFLLLMFLVLRVTIGTPVVFRQTRPGLFSKPFTMYKFRTMTDKRKADGSLLPDEERITNVGSFIRSWSLDELPEIFNVVKGDMSLVGPRPLMMQYLERYTPAQARRHEVMPGITGWVQVNGRNNLTWEEKFELDGWYVEHQSFRLDMRILALTIYKVLRRDGISEEGYVAASEFMGSNKEETH
jgi:lipopolysaccharide/colanic/teichoic acid biosynthesis glycosyltransferase